MADDNRKPAVLLLIAGAACHLSGLACMFFALSHAITSFETARAEGAAESSSNVWIMLAVAAMMLFTTGVILLILSFKKFWSGGSGSSSDDAA